MSFYRFNEDDIINVSMETHPASSFEANGQGDADYQVTGSVYLYKEYLNEDLETRKYFGFSQRLGGFVEKQNPLTSSIELLTAIQNSTNSQVYQTILNLYRYYSSLSFEYNAIWNGAQATTFRVMSIPQVYYDKEIYSGSFSASDYDANGDIRELYDNGRGGIYSGSMTGSIVGNIFYSEGLVVLKKSDLADFGNSGGSNNQYWSTNFRGVNKIPVKIFKCRAPAGQLNATTNPSFYVINSSSTDPDRNLKIPVLEDKSTYITAIGIFNENYELVATARTAQPIKKEEKNDLLFKVKIDW